MLSVVRSSLALSIFLSGPVAALELHILVVGEEGASSCGVQVSTAEKRVSQALSDRAIEASRHASPRGVCEAGRTWALLGEKLVKSGFASKVVFVPIAVPQVQTSEWSSGGTSFQKLASTVQTAEAESSSFDYAFWQGGASVGGDGAFYVSKLSKVIKFISLQMKVGKWIIAQGSGCHGEHAPEIAEALSLYGNNPVYRLFLGPDTDLSSDYFSKGCDLSERGRREMAERWSKSMIQADALNKLSQKESLLYYFR